MSDRAEHWWGAFALDEGETGSWKIGPLDLWVERAAREWRLAWSRQPEAGEEPSEWTVEIPAAPPEGADQASRHAFRRTQGPVRLTPLAADRAVIARPTTPLYVSPGEEATIYVSSALWVRVAVGAAAEQLQEIPTRLQSLTWFGPDSRRGELAYALRTRARRSEDELLPCPHRAVTTVEIKNFAATTLELDRLQLPVPYLRLYAAPDGRLWTETVTLERRGETEMANLEVASGAPPAAAGSQAVAEPRLVHERGLLIRAFSSLFR